jgi:transposase
MDKHFDKLYEDKAWLSEQLKTKTTREVAKDIGVSYKLINVWAVTHNLIRRTPDLVLP